MSADTRQDLIDEKTELLAALERDEYARDLEPRERALHRIRIRQIQRLLEPLSRRPRRVFMMP